MSSILIHHPSRLRERTASPRPIGPPILLPAALVPLLIAAWLAPPALIAPIVCLFALTMAALTAGYAWAKGAARDAPGLTAWDLAGLFVLAGLVAGSVSGAEQAMTLFGLAP